MLSTPLIWYRCTWLKKGVDRACVVWRFQGRASGGLARHVVGDVQLHVGDRGKTRRQVIPVQIFDRAAQDETVASRAPQVGSNPRVGEKHRLHPAGYVELVPVEVGSFRRPRPKVG